MCGFHIGEECTRANETVQSKPRIYLAGPYNHTDPKVMEQRYQTLTFCAANLMKQGYHVFSPITHNHPLKPYGLTDRDRWLSFDKTFMESWANMLVIADIDGWAVSEGVNQEIKHAIKLGLPIMMTDTITPDFDKVIKLIPRVV